MHVLYTYGVNLRHGRLHVLYMYGVKLRQSILESIRAQKTGNQNLAL